MTHEIWLAVAAFAVPNLTDLVTHGRASVNVKQVVAALLAVAAGVGVALSQDGSAASIGDVSRDAVAVFAGQLLIYLGVLKGDPGAGVAPKTLGRWTAERGIGRPVNGGLDASRPELDHDLLADAVARRLQVAPPPPPPPAAEVVEPAPLHPSVGLALDTERRWVG